MIYWNMYLPNILVVYTLMKNIFYLESIKSDGFKLFKNLLIVIIYLIYFYIFNIFQGIKLLYMTVIFLRYICSMLS